MRKIWLVPEFYTNDQIKRRFGNKVVIRSNSVYHPIRYKDWLKLKKIEKKNPQRDIVINLDMNIKKGGG